MQQLLMDGWSLLQLLNIEVGCSKGGYRYAADKSLSPWRGYASG